MSESDERMIRGDGRQRVLEMVGRREEREVLREIVHDATSRTQAFEKTVLVFHGRICNDVAGIIIRTFDAYLSCLIGPIDLCGDMQSDNTYLSFLTNFKNYFSQVYANIYRFWHTPEHFCEVREQQA